MSIRREKAGQASTDLLNALAELGVPARVEARGTMALLTVDLPTVERLNASGELRTQVVEAARAAGYAAVAIEIGA